MKNILDTYKGYKLIKNHYPGDVYYIAEVINTNFPVYFIIFTTTEDVRDRFRSWINKYRNKYCEYN